MVGIGLLLDNFCGIHDSNMTYVCQVCVLNVDMVGSTVRKTEPKLSNLASN